MAKQQLHVRLPIQLHVSNEFGKPDQFWAYYGDWLIAESSYKSYKEAKQKLLAKVNELLVEVVEAKNNTKQRVLLCNDGTMLVVCFDRGWGYSITRPGASHGGFSLGNWPRFDDAYKAACKHADDSYKGIKHEMPLRG